MAETERSQKFAGAFARWAKRVRSHLMARRIVAGATVGLVLGVGAAALAWWLREGELRPYGAALALLGATVGAWLAHRKRWSDVQVALYLDQKLATDEAIATAIELERDARQNGEDEAPVQAGKDSDRSPARAMVVDQATEALSQKPTRGVWPRVWRIWHALAPLGVGAILWLSLTQLPPLPPAPPPPPGSEMVTLDDVEGLEKVIELSELDPRDEAQRQRLNELSDRAKKLREKLRKGMEKREAQAEIAKLRDDVAAERQRFGSGKQREGLEAALSKMANNPQLDKAQKALGDRDLTAFDEEMEKLANKLEEQDREEAKKALEEAAKAAREKGAEDVAQALEEQKKLMEERAKRSQMMKDLAEAIGEGLSDEARKALEDYQGSGSSADQQKLADALGKAIEQLTDEERQKLADKLKQQAGKIDPNSADAMPMTKEQLENLQKQLGSPEGQKQLAEQLKKFANQPPQKSDGAGCQRGLGDAQRGLDDAQRQMGMPTPMPGGQGNKPGQGNQPGQGKGGQGKGGKPGQNGKSGPGGGQDNQGDGKGGPGPGGGQGKHDGSTKPLTGDSLRSRANAPINPGAPNPGKTMGRAPGRAGETANKQGTGQLGVVGPGEVGGVERSEVPEEYREQVGRYFQP
ncbi:MAG: hypothetical protein JRI68_27130 [Deltaproteobacteria bacterium]|nr:hypothetical protein [Deltaproteobacteria bacterium]